MLSVYYFEGRNGMMEKWNIERKKLEETPLFHYSIIPIPYDKLVTNYNLEYYYHFLNRTHVIIEG